MLPGRLIDAIKPARPAGQTNKCRAAKFPFGPGTIVSTVRNSAPGWVVMV
jgi:hypothetical protein